MAEVRSLPGIRYAAEGELAALVTPPYDVISPEAQARYYERSPENIIRLELGRDEPDDDTLTNRYTRAAVTFAEWRLRGVLRQDAPALYLYEQQFSAAGAEHRRLTLFARVRLEPWQAGVILPHERTLSKPKDDRLKLTRACAATLSPIMALYDDTEGALATTLDALRQREPTVSFTDEAGELQRLWVLDDPALAAEVAAFFAPRQLYIADGHHRYETALTYREEVRETRKELLPDDAANFTLMGLCAIEDAGLVVLPTHRIVRDLDPARLAALDESLRANFDIAPLGTLDSLDADDLTRRLAEAGQAAAFVLVSAAGAQLVRLREPGRAAMNTVAGEDAGTSAAWRGLDVAVLHELILRQALGVEAKAIRAGQYVSYTREPAAAVAAVRAQTDGAQLAVLLNPTPPAAIRDVARAGDRMPQKSTYFYPKLLTGLVINPLW